MLQDPFVLLALIGLVLFCTMALMALMLYRLVTNARRRRPSRPTVVPPEGPAPRASVPRLTEDPKLIAFMARGAPNFAREFPSLAGKPPARPSSEVAVLASSPAVVHERPDPQLISELPMPQPVSVRPDPVPVSPAREVFISRASPEPASAAAPDADLVALAELWPSLSARDRHELVVLARLKTRP